MIWNPKIYYFDSTTNLVLRLLIWDQVALRIRLNILISSQDIIGHPKLLLVWNIIRKLICGVLDVFWLNFIRGFHSFQVRINDSRWNTLLIHLDFHQNIFLIKAKGPIFSLLRMEIQPKLFLIQNQLHIFRNLYMRELQILNFANL